MQSIGHRDFNTELLCKNVFLLKMVQDSLFIHHKERKMPRLVKIMLGMSAGLLFSTQVMATEMISDCANGTSPAPYDSCGAVKLKLGQKCEDFYMPAGQTSKKTGNQMLCKENSGKHDCTFSQKRCKIETKTK